MNKKVFVEVSFDVIAFEDAGVLCYSGDYEGREWEEIPAGG